MKTEVDLREIQRVINLIFDHIVNRRGIEKVSLKCDFYWNIERDLLYDMSNPPTQFDVGSLEDDWGFVSGLLSVDSQPVAFQLTEIAPLLRRIGEVLGDQLSGQGG